MNDTQVKFPTLPYPGRFANVISLMHGIYLTALKLNNCPFFLTYISYQESWNSLGDKIILGYLSTKKFFCKTEQKEHANFDRPLLNCN